MMGFQLGHQRKLFRNRNLAQGFGLLLSLGIMMMLACGRPSGPASYFPETGKQALIQRSLDLKSNLNVLTVAVRPGYEDLSALAFFRMGRGAQIMSVYATNGEAMDSDVRSEYPQARAGILREEAFKAISTLDGEVRFLNMPDIAAARDEQRVREAWPSDSLQKKLSRIIAQFKPDIILCARDWRANGKSPMWNVMLDAVLKAVEGVKPRASLKTFLDAEYAKYWNVNRVLAETGKAGGFSIPVDEENPCWKKTYRDIGEEAGGAYASLAVQKALRNHMKPSRYHSVYPEGRVRQDKFELELDIALSDRVLGVNDRIAKLTQATLEGKKKGALTELVSIMESVNLLISRRFRLSLEEKKILYQWKLELEKLRCTLLDVSCQFTISDTVITERQLTFLTLYDLKGVKSQKNIDIYFPNVEQGWIVNEEMRKKFPLKLNEMYRLMMSKPVDFSLPPGYYTKKTETYGTPFFFYLLKHSDTEDKNFVYNRKITFLFSPRFTTEVLNPIIRMEPDAGIALRLTNISRDGVMDTVRVRDELATSSNVVFRFDGKGESLLDTLHLTWKKDPKEGSYIFPITIYDTDVSNIVARKFDAEVDQSKKVGLIAGLEASPLPKTLKSLGVTFHALDIERPLTEQLNNLDVVLVDRRALTLKSRLREHAEALNHFVTSGGHLIVLAQDAAAWNDHPLWEGIMLESTVLWDEETPVDADQSHIILSAPNRISRSDWRGWLFMRAHNLVSSEVGDSVYSPIKVKDEEQPLILIEELGNGKRTYVDLALNTQLLNIQSGAYRLLANLISY